MPTETDQRVGLLSPFKALDLTDEQGLFCGQFLASLGAEVIKVEPPEGDRARSRGPFYQDTPGPDTSLYYHAYNSNKKSITLDLESLDGRSLFRRLVADADFVIESFKPGY